MDIYIRVDLLGVSYKRLVHAEPLEIPGAVRKYAIHENNLDGCFVVTDIETGMQVIRHAKRRTTILQMRDFIKAGKEIAIKIVTPTLNLTPLDDLPEWVD